MNKKVLTSLLTMSVLMVPALQSVSATSPITAIGDTDSKDVTASMDTSDGGTVDTSTVYSVDVTWGSLAFTYGVDSSQTATTAKWNPATHTYTDSITATSSQNIVWKPAEDGISNKITVTNHSNAGVKADLTYTAKDEFSKIKETFSNGNITLNTAEGTEVANAPTDFSTLSLAGELNKTITNGTAVGTVTVTLTENK